MAIEFFKRMSSFTASDSYRIIDIKDDGSIVHIDGCIEYEELEQILNKMKELRDGENNTIQP